MSHARLGPSNHRWPHCPGSVREEANYPDSTSEAAIDGTGSHVLLELCLENNVRAEAYIGHVIGLNDKDRPMGWHIDNDRAARVQMCLDYVARRHGELTAKYPDAVITIESETKANPGGLVGRTDWWGTVDITITVMQDGSCLFIEICDYKDGRGWVSVRDKEGELNTQLTSYGLGKMRPYIGSGPDLVRPFKSQNVRDGVRLCIVQPKTNPVVRYEDVSSREMIAQMDWLSPAAAKTDDKDAPLIPDNKGGKGYCKWCSHRANCIPLLQKPLDTVKTMTTEVMTTGGTSLFETIEQSFANVETMSDVQLADLLDARDGINAAFDRVATEIQKRVETGIPVPGYQMQPGRVTQVWTEEEDVIAAKLKSRRLKKDQIYPAKLITPAQVMSHPDLTDMQKKKIKEELITEKAGKLALKKIARDAAPRVEKDVNAMFGEVAETVPTNTVVEATIPETTVEQAAPAATISFL